MIPQEELNRELAFMVLQFLDENEYKETARRLEIESGVFFNLRYFEACVKNGEWDEVEKYLSGFMKVDDNRYSMKTFFDIRKQKYFEALDKRDHARAADILVNELKPFSKVNEQLFKEITFLLTAENLREHEQLSEYDTVSARVALFDALKSLIELNPIFHDKLQFPGFENSTLVTLINQSSGGQSSHGSQTHPSSPIPLMGGYFPRDAGFSPSGSPGNGDVRSMLEDVKPSTAELEKYMIQKLTEMNNPYQLRSLKLPDGLLATKIVQMTYTNSGSAILALAHNAVHKLWKWPETERNPSGKASTSEEPAIWSPTSKILMTNDISDVDVQNSVPCFALSKNGFFVTSSSGGKISLFNMMTFRPMTTFFPPPPSPTSMAFHPRVNSRMAIGMDDSTIHIFDVRTDQILRKLICHQKRVTGLAFSSVLSVLVSSGADAQLCVWDMDGWKKLGSAFLRIPSESAPSPLAPTRLQFHQDQTHFLAVHETQIAIYKAPNLELLTQWKIPRCSISDATYSCDGQSIYASLEDGSLRVLTASTLQLKCSTKVYPNAIAANPNQPNQFAVGFSNGGVYVVEPLESEHGWSSGTEPRPSVQ